MNFKGVFHPDRKELSLGKSQKKFLFSVFILTIGWFVISFIEPVTVFFTYLVSKGSVIFISLVTGTKPGLMHNPHHDIFSIFDGRGHITVAPVCNALSIFYVCVAFILAIPNQPVKRKIKYAVLGGLAIIAANILRISGLFFIAKNHPQWFAFTHKTLFQVLIYLVLFSIWMLYLRSRKKPV